jgi:HKD family nuclease
VFGEIYFCGNSGLATFGYFNPPEMKITFLAQGYEPESKNAIGQQIIKFFGQKDFHSFTAISAFTSLSAVDGLGKQIAKASELVKDITIITGIDLKGTSKEALEALMNLTVNSFVFYQDSQSIFHPKIYLWEGKDRAELIIGSSNLTGQGLFTNVEASVLISIDNARNEGRKILEQLKEYYKGIFEGTDPNLKRISPELISELVHRKLVPTEAERKALYEKVPSEERKERKKSIRQIFPKRKGATIPPEWRQKVKLDSKATPRAIKLKASVLLWQSGPLTERDLNIPHGSNTNATGSMLIKKGKLKGIDQRHYFRETTFSSLPWKKDPHPGKMHFERANANFRLIVMGQDQGVYNLTLSHNTKKTSVSYKQSQPMTFLSWGPAKPVIAKKELIGKNASIYSDKKGEEFILVIE